MQFSIYGLGSLGSNLLIALVKQYPGATFHGYDFDLVEDRNIRNQAFYLEHVNLYKADAMRIILSRYVRNVKYVPHKERVTLSNLKIEVNSNSVAERHVVVDCFDNTEARALFKNYMGNILHIGFSPQYTAEAIWNEHYTAPNDIQGLDICSMPEAILFIHYVIAAASMTLSHFILTGEKQGMLVKRDNQSRMSQVYL